MKDAREPSFIPARAQASKPVSAAGVAARLAPDAPWVRAAESPI